ncbi:DUF2239 family protein [Microbulbifer sp. SAOS-129_SWC]|uniref:DUF2239 family protein n=1 Tax=Microbulbifer sp. SAOS-129_SWC TaxID=3145235 RepID=UPI003216AAA3
MPDNLSPLRCTAFSGQRCIASGNLREVAHAAHRAAHAHPECPILIFDDCDSRPVELDLRGSEAEVLARLPTVDADQPPPIEKPRGRGRPKLGVVAREVTLLPRHWDWLKSQPGGASVALRKLVEEARRANLGRDRRRAAQESCYRFMTAIAGDLPGFEEATRALFAGERALFGAEIAAWPEDIRSHCERIAADAFSNPRTADRQGGHK